MITAAPVPTGEPGEIQFCVRNGHPRSLVGPEELQIIRRRAETTHRREFESLVASVRDVEALLSSGRELESAALRAAFAYLISQDRTFATGCAQLLRPILDQPANGEYFGGPRRIKTLGCAYDWVHQDLGDDELLERLGRGALEACQAVYDSGEVDVDHFIIGHNANMTPKILMAALAVHDEIEGSGKYIANVLWRWKQMLPTWNRFLEDESFLMSYPYTVTYIAEIPWFFQAMEAGLGIDMFNQYPQWRGCVNWWTYALRDDETFIRYGDYFCSMPLFGNAAYFRPFACLAHRYRDPLAQWWVQRFNLRHGEMDQLIYEERENAVQPVAPDEMKLKRTKYFQPMGIAMARGDFDSGTVASFKCSPIYLHNHCHRDNNSFTLYHKGDLAIDSGAYDGYETDHWHNYYIRTIAHNSIVIHDPQETFVSRGKALANDGGQQFVNDPYWQPRVESDLDRPEFIDGTITRYQEGEGWSYVCGDASNSYHAGKVERFLRHAVFVLDYPRKSMVSMVILDELELAREGMTPRFLLHTMEQPEVNGPRVTAAHRLGRLTLHALLPAAPKIEVIGGEGGEFLVDGANHAMRRDLKGPHTPGKWRVELSPAENGRSVRFLTVLTPNSVNAPPDDAPSLREVSGGYLIELGDVSIALARGGKLSPARAKRMIGIDLADPANRWRPQR